MTSRNDARDEKGRFPPGKSGNPAGGGRPALPSWFRERGPDALRVLLAQATGEVIPCDDGKVLPAVRQVAEESSTKERKEASVAVAERIYGKVKDVVEVEGDLTVSEIVRVIVDGRKAKRDDASD